MQQSAGFSLLELMITLSIMAILATMAIPNYQLYIKKAKFSQVLSQVMPYKSAVEICYQLNNSVGSSESNCGTAGENDIPNDFISLDKTGYVRSVSTIFDNNTVKIITETQGLGENYTYILRAKEDNAHLKWDVDPASTCLKAKLCRTS